MITDLDYMLFAGKAVLAEQRRAVASLRSDIVEVTELAERAQSVKAKAEQDRSALINRCNTLYRENQRLNKKAHSITVTDPDIPHILAAHVAEGADHD